jgi:hypothetical protein
MNRPQARRRRYYSHARAATIFGNGGNFLKNTTEHEELRNQLRNFILGDGRDSYELYVRP